MPHPPPNFNPRPIPRPNRPQITQIGADSGPLLFSCSARQTDYSPPVLSPKDKTGAWLSLVERLVRDQEVAGSNPVAPTILDSVPFRPRFSTGRSTPPAGAAADSPYCSPDAATTFPRRTDQGRRQGRRGFQARGDGRERRDLFGWRPTICGTAHPYGFPRSAAGSGGRRVRQGRRAERQGRLSGTPLPKGGRALRAPLAAVGSGQVAPLPALWRSFLARGRERFAPAAFRNPLP